MPSPRSSPSSPGRERLFWLWQKKNIYIGLAFVQAAIALSPSGVSFGAPRWSFRAERRQQKGNSEVLMSNRIRGNAMTQPRADGWQAALGRHKLLLACSVALFFFAGEARAQTSAFTFQGRLNDSGVPANGNYDLELKLFDTPAAGTGTQIGSTIDLPGVKVTSGVFTVQLDFTAAAFSGGDRFVEVGVTPAGSGAPFTVLDPRQPITPTPYALFSLNAAMAPGNFNIAGNGTLLGTLSVGQATPNTYPFSVVGKTGTGENQAAASFSNDSPDTGVTIKNSTPDGAAWTLFSSGTGSILDPPPVPPAPPNTTFANGAFSIYDVAAKSPRLMIDSSGGVTIARSLYINTTAGIALDAETKSGGEAVYAECLQSGNNCYALEAYAPAGDYAGYMYGGKGVYAESDDASQSGVDANAYGANAYALHAESATYRGGYFKSDSNALFSLYVDDKDGPTQGTAALNVHGGARVEGNLTVIGSKSGYVVDIMQNVDNAALEPGDVVVIVGNSAPVLGQIPVITVKKAAGANDTGLAGIVDQVWSAPDAATKAAYEAQENAVRTAMKAQATARTEARTTRHAKAVDVPMPAANISDEQGTLHALPNVTSAGTGGYVSVVTLGSFKMVKVDASLGAIQTGDLLTTSTTPGYAMKAAPVVVNGVEIYRTGTILGKALEPLDKGTGLIKVFVTLR
jgi:hypothetical protein